MPFYRYVFYLSVLSTDCSVFLLRHSSFLEGNPQFLQPVYYFFGFALLESVVNFVFLYRFFFNFFVFILLFFSNLLIFQFILPILSSIKFISSNVFMLFAISLFYVSMLISFFVAFVYLIVELVQFLVCYSCV